MDFVPEKREFKKIDKFKEKNEPKRARTGELIRCKFMGIYHDVEINEKTTENRKTTCLSEIFRIELVDGYYIATLRKDVCIEVSENRTIFKFVHSETTNPPVVLGSGAFGIVFKIMGTDGKWYVVKSFDDSHFARDEWISLEKLSGKHSCIQRACGYQINRDGDLKHIIVSEHQGDLTLSECIRKTNGKCHLELLIKLFLDLLGGIDEIHRQGLIHGDIKIENIICMKKLDGTYQLVLIDFGYSKKIGELIDNPNSIYTWWFRCWRMFLDKLMKGFPFVKPVRISPIMDLWAFFVSMLHSFSNRSIDFLGFRSKTEEQARRVMSENSCALWLMKKINNLGFSITDISFIQQIYFVLLNKQGPEQFLKIFNSFGFTLDEPEKMYAEYVEEFHKLRNESPIIGHVKRIFHPMRMSCDKKDADISEILRAMTDLFVEILRDGADLSLLDALGMKHIESWVAKLKEILKMIDEIGGIYF
jgi:serine/threonine protein kinase